METVDDEILDAAVKFIDKSKKDGKPFFVWLNPTRMHVVTHLSEKYEELRNAAKRLVDGRGRHGELDDIVGSVMKKLEDDGLEDNTIVVFTTDNGAENFTWPDGGQTPFAGGKGTAWKGASACRASCAGPARFRQARWRTASSRGWIGFRPFCAAAGNPNIVEELKQGKQLGDATYKVHLDGFDQTDLITGQGPSQRHEVFYFTEGTLSAVRIDDYKYRFTDQPNGWLGTTVKVDWPILVIFGWIPLSGRVCTMAWLGRWLITTGSPTSSGVLSSCNRRSGNTPRLHRVSAVAKGGQLQYGSRQAADRSGH